MVHGQEEVRLLWRGGREDGSQQTAARQVEGFAGDLLGEAGQGGVPLLIGEAAQVLVDQRQRGRRTHGLLGRSVGAGPERRAQ